jgi:hypothetical protein
MRTLFKDILFTLPGVLLGIGIAWWEFAHALAGQLRPAVVQSSVVLLLSGFVFVIVVQRRRLLFISAVVPVLFPLWVASFVERGSGLWLGVAAAHVSALGVGSLIGYFISRYVTRNAA